MAQSSTVGSAKQVEGAKRGGRESRVAPQSFLTYKNFRYLKLSLGLLGLAILVFWWDEPIEGRSGGSWVGYGLGGVCTAMILWLMWFGIRKRRYASRGAPLKTWLSGHVYLGLSLLLLVPLHSAFQFGWNVHTLAYALMSAVIVSGIAGVLFYASVPDPMTRNRPGQKLDGLLEDIADTDAECGAAASGLPDVFARAVSVAIDETQIGGGLLAQFNRQPIGCGTTRALDTIRDVKTDDLDSAHQSQVQRLLELLSHKQALLARVRRDMRYKALLDLWLLVHVPLSFATLAVVGIHIFVVFYYR